MVYARRAARTGANHRRSGVGRPGPQRTFVQLRRVEGLAPHIQTVCISVFCACSLFAERCLRPVFCRRIRRWGFCCRYASLYFVFCADKSDNELLILEVIHSFVELLDRFFGNVCELDLIFNFHKAYLLLDELVLAGEIQETSKKGILRVVASQDQLSENTDPHAQT